jgi:tripartite ATP-independent transporter DctP family solute receptor
MQTCLKRSRAKSFGGGRLLRSLLVLGCAIAAIDGAVASTRLVSLVFASSLNNPQRVGGDTLRKAVLTGAEGRLAVDIRGSSNMLGSENMVLAATQSGSVNVAVLSGSVVSSAVPELGIFDIPFLFRDAAHARAVAEGTAGASIAAKFADKGLVLLAIGKQGFRNITNSERPIRTPADLKGLKIRVIPNEIYQMTFKALGAEVVPMEFPLVYAALKDGRIQGQENPVDNIVANHIYEVQKYLSMTGHFFAPVVFIANRDFFQSLDPADQAALRAAAKAGADATWQSGADLEAKSLETVRNSGMQVVEQVDRQPFIDAVKPLEPEFEKRFGKELLSAVRAAR